MDKSKLIGLVEEFSKPINAKTLIMESFNEIKPVKGNLFAFFLSLILSLFISIPIGYSANTITIIYDIFGLIINIFLTLFGFILAVYSILLAFLNEDYIKKLCNIQNNKGQIILKETLGYYESVLFLYFIALGVTSFLYMVLTFIDRNYALTTNFYCNFGLASFLLSLYFFYIFRVFYEIKSVIYNTVMLFRESIAYKILGIISKETRKDEKDASN